MRSLAAQTVTTNLLPEAARTVVPSLSLHPAHIATTSLLLEAARIATGLARPLDLHAQILEGRRAGHLIGSETERSQNPLSGTVSSSQMVWAAAAQPCLAGLTKTNNLTQQKQMHPSPRHPLSLHAPTATTNLHPEVALTVVASLLLLLAGLAAHTQNQLIM